LVIAEKTKKFLIIFTPASFVPLEFLNSETSGFISKNSAFRVRVKTNYIHLPITLIVYLLYEIKTRVYVHFIFGDIIYHVRRAKGCLTYWLLKMIKIHAS
jgi:hypothetical protein